MRYIPGQALGPRTARSAARQAWGPVNRCYTIVPGVYAVDTWGHGGIIVATGPSEPFNLDESLRTEAYFLTKYTVDGEPVCTWYLFEEDCDWAMVIEAHPELLAPAIRKGYFAEGLTIEYVRERAQDNRDHTVKAAARSAAIAAHPERYVSCARGDWAEGTPKGMVEVTTYARTVLYMPSDEYRDHDKDAPLPEQYVATARASLGWSGTSGPVTFAD